MAQITKNILVIQDHIGHMNQAYEYISAVGQNTSLFMSNLDNAATSPASVFCNKSAGGDLMPGFFVHSMLNNLKYHVSFISLTVD